MTAAEKILGCSNTTSNTVLRAELGMYPLETNRREKAEIAIQQYNVRNMPEKRLLAIADSAAWEKTAQRRAGIRWENVLEKIWKGLGDREEVLSIEELGGYKTGVQE